MYTYYRDIFKKYINHIELSFDKLLWIISSSWPDRYKKHDFHKDKLNLLKYLYPKNFKTNNVINDEYIKIRITCKNTKLSTNILESPSYIDKELFSLSIPTLKVNEILTYVIEYDNITEVIANCYICYI